jgi:hypothetical protein
MVDHVTSITATSTTGDRTADGWRIAVLVMTPDWATGNQHIMTLAAGVTQ